MSRQRLLLTGAAGFVGRVIAPMLRSSFPDHDVVEVVREEPAPPGGYACDLSGREATRALVAQVAPEIVVHLAAYSSVGLARSNPTAVWRDNAVVSVWVAEAVADYAPSATVLLASSGEVYGHALASGPATEETPPQPTGPYATSKLASEHAFSTTLPEEARLITVRSFNHTGAGQSEQFAIPSFAAQLARIEKGLVPAVLEVGNLAAKRDFLDVRDVAEAYVRLLEGAGRLPRRALINLARGEAFSIRSILDRLLRECRVPVEVTVDPKRMRPNEIPEATARPDRLSALMPWPPPRPFEETLRLVLEDKRARA